MAEIKIKECSIRPVQVCDKEDNIVNVAKILKEHKERHAIVLDKIKPVGIISTTDMNNRVVAENKDLKKTKAENIMTSHIMIRDIEDSLAKTYFEMLKDNIFSCVILEKGKLKGALDLREAMNHLVKVKAKEK